MISIIIPTLNEEKYLPLLLKSIKEQDYNGELETIVADAGSHDKTKEIARNFQCQVVKGGNISQGRNSGARAAKGELLLFTDADVVLPKHFLETAVKEFTSRKLDGASFFIYPIQNNWFKTLVFNIFYNYPVKLIVKAFPFGSMTFLVKKEIHQKIKGFNEKVVFLEDTEYIRRLAKAGKYRILEKPAIYASTRRFEEHGWIRTYTKIIIANIYTIFFGPITKDIFHYKFNCHQ